MVVVVVVDLDGDGDVEVDATFGTGQDIADTFTRTPRTGVIERSALRWLLLARHPVYLDSAELGKLNLAELHVIEPNAPFHPTVRRQPDPIASQCG